MKNRFHTFLLLLANVLLILNLIVSLTHPSLDDIEHKIRRWGQHFGAHYSN